MGSFVVLVDFKIHDAQVGAFRELVVENSAASIRDESGCRQFDVLVQDENPSRVVLYEIYDSAEAFDAHLLTSHFKHFDGATSAMVAERRIERFRRL